MAGFIGNKIGGTPALQLPDDKGRRRGGENPAGGARGGGGVRGVERFFFQEARGIEFEPRRISIGGCEVHAAATPPRRLRAAPWTPPMIVNLDCWVFFIGWLLEDFRMR